MQTALAASQRIFGPPTKHELTARYCTISAALDKINGEPTSLDDAPAFARRDVTSILAVDIEQLRPLKRWLEKRQRRTIIQLWHSLDRE